MKLYHSPNSPFAKKVVIVAALLKLRDRLELIPTKAEFLVRDAELRAHNPSGQIPTLITDDGIALFDSNVICAYLDHVADGRIIGNGSERWRNMRDAALADTMTSAAIQVRYEVALRPQEKQWGPWTDAWLGKIIDALNHLDKGAGFLAGRVDIGSISIFCALSYLDWRFAHLEWKQRHKDLALWYESFCQRSEIAPYAAIPTT